jgi:hypothetical protein
MPSGVISYRLVDRDGHELRVASFEPNIQWRIGDVVTLGRDDRFVIVEIQDGDQLVRATWVVDALP